MFIHRFPVCRRIWIQLAGKTGNAAGTTELSSCSVEVLHGRSLVRLLRPPFTARGVFFQDQMDGSDIPTEILTIETTCMHWPD